MHLDLKSNMNTDGRTDERYEESPSVANQLQAVTHGRVTEDPARLSDLLDPAALWPTERHPVIRSGERDPIPSHVRAAVWFRDHGKCELCGFKTPSDKPWHLDHITPWSAGGSDDTTNLRVLCEQHNKDRGNRVDATERPRRAATWWCVNCYANDDWPWQYDSGYPTCRVHGVDVTHPSVWRCPVIRGYRAALTRGEPMPTWHHVPPLNSWPTVAYCAHCRAPGLTSRPL